MQPAQPSEINVQYIIIKEYWHFVFLIAITLRLYRFEYFFIHPAINKPVTVNYSVWD